jgi:putative acetyltransferase
MLEISREDPGTTTAIGLVAALLDELEPLYHQLWANPFDPAELRGERCLFVVARRDGAAVGCGGIRLLEADTAEVRRMYVIPDARRTGVARAVLAQLEQLAADLGYTTFRLETGIYQPDAIRLYDRCGYVRIEPYGAYAGDPLSVCFEKRLR